MLIAKIQAILAEPMIFPARSLFWSTGGAILNRADARLIFHDQWIELTKDEKIICYCSLRNVS